MSASEHPKSQYIISYLTIRKSIGFIGISLPAALFLGNLLVGQCRNLEDSISHFYYTIMGDVFVGALCAVSLFLFTYRGYDPVDNKVTSLAGLCALGVAFFPTSSIGAECMVAKWPYSPFRNLYMPWIHYSFASLFFLTLAYMAYFQFTKSKGEMTPQKVWRNQYYQMSAIAIVICIAVIFLIHIVPLFQGFEQYKSTFWLEWLALLAFGSAWLVKGELFWEDHPPA